MFPFFIQSSPGGEVGKGGRPREAAKGGELLKAVFTFPFVQARQPSPQAILKAREAPWGGVPLPPTLQLQHRQHGQLPPLCSQRSPCEGPAEQQQGHSSQRGQPARKQPACLPANSAGVLLLLKGVFFLQVGGQARWPAMGPPVLNSSFAPLHPRDSDGQHGHKRCYLENSRAGEAF